MLKNISRLECIVNDKIFHLFCDMDSPLDCVKEALFQFQKYIGQVEDAVKKQKEEEEKKEEEESIVSSEVVEEPQEA